jgi:hypothetical protein
MMNDMMSAMMKDSMAGMDMSAMEELIEACSACEQACTMCSAADMGMPDMGKCAGMCANCADVCNTMMRMLMRPIGMDADSMMSMMQATMTMAAACEEECMMHADMGEQHRMCAQACQQVVMASEAMMMSMNKSMSA